MPDKENILKDEMINLGQKLYQARLTVAKSGNISVRLDDQNILITTTGACLGDLTNNDFVKINLSTNEPKTNKKPSTELPLHSLIYRSFSCQAIIHCHPPLINGYFAVYPDIKALTFETKLYLGNVPVVEQDTPSVVKPELVVEALKTNNLAVLRRHGVVSIGDNFLDALHLIETLEEAVKTAGLARIFKQDMLDDLDKELKESLSDTKIYPMFSKEHIQAIVDLVNKDEFILRKGKELDLTVKLAIKMEESTDAYKFNFEEGKITKLEFSAAGGSAFGGDADAPFVISAPAPVWEQVFLGKLDSFVAVTQGKMKLQGQLGQLSKWYVPFSRLFELFKQVKIK
jgi:L-fuculose-phosphate aldolase